MSIQLSVSVPCVIYVLAFHRLYRIHPSINLLMWCTVHSSVSDQLKFALINPFFLTLIDPLSSSTPVHLPHQSRIFLSRL